MMEHTIIFFQKAEVKCFLHAVYLSAFKLLNRNGRIINGFLLLLRYAFVSLSLNKAYYCL